MQENTHVVTTQDTLLSAFFLPPIHYRGIHKKNGVVMNEYIYVMPSREFDK